MKPALTAEEWKNVARIDGSTKELHQYAALALYGQPFGFSCEDVVTVREAANEMEMDGAAEWPGIGILRSLADRIEALLPPEAGQ